MEMLTLWIAVIGCFTGILSLCIEFAGYLSEKPRTKVATFNELCNVIWQEKDLVKCYLHIRIFNTGIKPIILQDVYMRRPNAKRNRLENLVHYHKAFARIPWRLCNDIPINETPESIKLPISIAAGETFDACFVFLDHKVNCYASEERIICPTACVCFVPGKIKECKIQAVNINSETVDEFNFVDSDGNSWGL